ncbi:hypothetical protein GCWU000324_01643 [Kingella oralis ATCC 51147]|uniref:Uncharacterized protein n=1 Tax=Kingella oralis ATCC 51147 TaxID=629741 RepID=C4GKY7_9NEIS|nr:hypothetical protein GCWU000324_01643 [Kingella oralis ATCC 51147]
MAGLRAAFKGVGDAVQAGSLGSLKAWYAARRVFWINHRNGF